MGFIECEILNQFSYLGVSPQLGRLFTFNVGDLNVPMFILIFLFHIRNIFNGVFLLDYNIWRFVYLIIQFMGINLYTLIFMEMFQFCFTLLPYFR